MTRDEINSIEPEELTYIASIPLNSLLKFYNKNVSSHVFLYKFYLIRVETQNNKVNHVFVTNSSFRTEYLFSNSKAAYNYTFEEDCKRQSIDDIKDFLFNIALLIKKHSFVFLL